jgi:HSP20 family molecular chaperone IbpA
MRVSGAGLDGHAIVDPVSFSPHRWVHKHAEGTAQSFRNCPTSHPDRQHTWQRHNNSHIDLRQKAPTFDMTGLYAHPDVDYDPPLQLVDHPRERLHQHNTFLGVVARKNPDQKAYPNHPDVDISDAISYYLIELEVPGIKSADSIALNWTSWRSLVVAGSSFRSWELPTSANPEKAGNGDRAGGSADGSDMHVSTLKVSTVKANGVNDQLPQFLVIGERRIGSFRREFHFPMDVVVDKVEAKLEAGLLRIRVPKKSHMDLKGVGMVRVQGMD